nr:hypothetical protein Iba_chr15eCG4970 [Ipomoea batatas]
MAVSGSKRGDGIEGSNEAEDDITEVVLAEQKRRRVVDEIDGTGKSYDMEGKHPHGLEHYQSLPSFHAREKFEEAFLVAFYQLQQHCLLQKTWRLNYHLWGSAYSIQLNKLTTSRLQRELVRNDNVVKQRKREKPTSLATSFSPVWLVVAVDALSESSSIFSTEPSPPYRSS